MYPVGATDETISSIDKEPLQFVPELFWFITHNIIFCLNTYIRRRENLDFLWYSVKKNVDFTLILACKAFRPESMSLQLFT